MHDRGPPHRCAGCLPGGMPWSLVGTFASRRVSRRPPPGGSLPFNGWGELQDSLRGRYNAFEPSPGLKQFLVALKGAGIKIGLVTSGLREKAWPEILSAFRTLQMGNPLEFYDAIITAGERLTRGQTGTLGELAPKPHPWLYAETAYVGLAADRSRRHKVVGLEDSGAGVVSIRLAGFAAIGVRGGNIDRSGVRPLLHAYCDSLLDALPLILGK